MAGWPRMIRAVIGTGVTFAAGIGAVAAAAGVVAVLAGEASWRDLFEAAGRLTVVGFLLGVGFAGILAISARRHRLARLSVPRFAALGAGAGLLYFGLIALNAWDVWTPANAIGNLVILTVMGGASATAVVLIARRGRPALTSGEDPTCLEGPAQPPRLP